MGDVATVRCWLKGDGLPPNRQFDCETFCTCWRKEFSSNPFSCRVYVSWGNFNGKRLYRSYILCWHIVGYIYIIYLVSHIYILGIKYHDTFWVQNGIHSWSHGWTHHFHSNPFGISPAIKGINNGGDALSLSIYICVCVYTHIWLKTYLCLSI